MGKVILVKASDYIVEFLCEKGITHFFGYQGTMIAHFIDSIGKNPKAENHTCYNEQGAAFAAVGYAKASGHCAVAYATSGPGAINLMSGIADAYYDSAPVIFLTGQLNTNEYTAIPELRQQGFQETNVVAMASSITKYCRQITNVEELPAELEKAYEIATSGRMGPVLLDLPMNIQRFEVDVDSVKEKSTGMSFNEKMRQADEVEAVCQILDEVCHAKRPLLLLGNGISKKEEDRRLVRRIIDRLGIPVITSMLGRDLLPADHPLNYGMIGSAYGHRHTNLLACQKADCILSIGCSMCPRQIGMKPDNFAPQAQIIRVDIDEIQLKRQVHKDEKVLVMDSMKFFHYLDELLEEKKQNCSDDHKDTRWETVDKWKEVCRSCKEKLDACDQIAPEMAENRLMTKISHSIKDGTLICADVGQHQVWTATSFDFQKEQRFLCSGGHGAMGFSIPAAIGAYYATKRPVLVLCGDGSAQMNIQELQWIRREHLPITILILNNSILGLIRQQQDSIFEGRYVGAAREGGYEVPDFEQIAKAYGLYGKTISAGEIMDQEQQIFTEYLSDAMANAPSLIQITMRDHTVAFPKTVFGEPMYNQKPYVSPAIMEELLKL